MRGWTVVRCLCDVKEGKAKNRTTCPDTQVRAHLRCFVLCFGCVLCAGATATSLVRVGRWRPAKSTT